MDSESIAKICATTIVISIVFWLVSCQPSAEELEARAKVIEAESKQLQISEQAKRVREQDKMNNMRILIQDEEVSPFAARCAIYGPNGSSNADDARCAEASKLVTGK